MIVPNRNASNAIQASTRRSRINTSPSTTRSPNVRRHRSSNNRCAHAKAQRLSGLEIRTRLLPYFFATLRLGVSVIYSFLCNALGHTRVNISPLRRITSLNGRFLLMSWLFMPLKKNAFFVTGSRHVACRRSREGERHYHWDVAQPS